ncbi:phasin family protein [Pseudoruegeria sp. SHC-113]|uniref:phasin family protein n=1 Tax=Pseudoruegeria sp. SHC-113 TaxID=2855439 RepID=UPI0021BB30AA|nr:phasin family protein [Pseudoruegeria sp. SHC-113]MCT8159781.1 phasin family protein [Pseudoruegeria sp. SHC-113]
MAKTPDFAKTFQDALASMNVDTKAFEEAIKSSAELGEKMSKITLSAAEESADLSAKWTKDTLAKMGAASTAKTDPAELGKAVTDFASSSAEKTAESMAAFAEIVKKVQLETVELLMSAGKDFNEDAQAAMKKAADEAQAAVKKATDELTKATTGKK